MQDLRLIGVQEDGHHLLLAAPDGTRYRVPLDEPLRAAVRHDRPRLGQLQIEMEGGMRPREVQSLIRAGATAEEVADRSGWSVDKVRRYEGPILAERVHVADQARLVRVRSRGGASGATVPTLQARVVQRMRERGVDAEASTWDAWRGVEDAHWTVAVLFAAGGRQRQATWTYDPVLRTVEAADDEARWLSADEPAAVGPVPTTTPRVSNVYDVEAEGGVAASARRAGASGRAARDEEPLDLMTAMRQRTTVGRRSGRRRPAAAEPAHRETAPALPLEGDADVEPVADPPDATQAPHVVPAPEAAGSAVAGEEPLLEPPGAETPPLDEDWDEPADDRPADDRPAEDAAGVDDAVTDDPGDDRTDLTDFGDLADDGDDDEVVDDLGGDVAVEDVGPVAAPAARAGRRKQRPSVPSWDDIMFGAKRE
jgi:hypothetical protein